MFTRLAADRSQFSLAEQAGDRWILQLSAHHRNVVVWKIEQLHSATAAGEQERTRWSGGTRHPCKSLNLVQQRRVGRRAPRAEAAALDSGAAAGESSIWRRKLSGAV